jgi:hypothetical protein
VSDIDTAAADGLKVLDPKWPIREADIGQRTITPQHRATAVGAANDMAARVASIIRSLCREKKYEARL